MSNTTPDILGVVQGRATSALADALGNVIKDTYITNVTYDSSTHTLSFWCGSVLKYSCVVAQPMQDDITKPLYLLSKQNGSTIRLVDVGLNEPFQTSTDNVTWSDYTFDSDIVLDDGEGVYFRIKSERIAAGNAYKCVKFRVLNGVIEAYNNILSLVHPTNFANITSNTLDCLFIDIFEVTSTDVGIYKAPLLPLTTIGNYAYKRMFYGCTHLSKAPELPANIAGVYCYQEMFSGCTSLTLPPDLPSTSVHDGCYDSMFLGCTSLTKGPALPATSLPGTGSGVYYKMFQGCTSITEIRIYATSGTSAVNLDDWLYRASPTGDFYCVPGAEFQSNINGIPSGWTRRDINDYPN